MPELPEVETMRRQITPVVGATITGILRPRSTLRPISIRPSFPAMRKALCGGRIEAVERLGKRLILRVLKEGDNHALVIEPRMTGSLTLLRPPDRKHLRLIFQLEGGQYPQLFFWDSRGLGVLHLMSDRKFKQLRQRLGKDAREISARELAEKLSRSSRAIKVALMDQAIVAGIGNLYASEILFHAGIHPATPCRALADPQWRQIVRSMRHVLRRAIEAQGSTLSDGTYRNPMGEKGQFQFSHYVYQKDGELCRRCRTGTITRLKQGGRSTFFCPVCQDSPK